MQNFALDIQINKKDFHDFRVVHKEAPSENDLDQGQILMKIEKFALTANNITYAVVGETMGYWNFFPVSEKWGIIPVWGYGQVMASKNEHIPIGQRFYGYYPMSTHVVMSPEKARSSTFTDGAGHRRQLPAVYNVYLKVPDVQAHSSEDEAIQSLFRPLFTTSFLLEDFIFDNNFFEAKNIIITSASSKTAICLAYLLSQRNKTADMHLTGLTSGRNTEFVKSLGYYDAVYAYENVASIPGRERSVVIDFSGNRDLQEFLETHLAQQMAYLCLVGIADWTNQVFGSPQNGEFFFAPSQFKKRQKEWGSERLQDQLGQAWHDFTPEVRSWMTIKEVMGTEALSALYLSMLDGNVDPRSGYIIGF